MFGSLLKSFMRQIVIIKAPNILKEVVEYFWKKCFAFFELLDKNMNINYSRQQIKGQMDRK